MRAHRWRTALMGPPTSWMSMREKVTMRTSTFHDQIMHDVYRTFTSDPWFDAHRPRLARMLNTFAMVNAGVGYIQGMNYLMFPLWKVYYSSCPTWAVEDTLASMQTILHLTLRTYATRVDDARAYEYVKTLVGMIRLRAVTLHSDMHVLFDRQYTPFLQSMVSTMIPTLFANALSIDAVLLLWDQFFAADTRRQMFDRAMDTLVCLIVHHRNLFVHLSVIQAMDLFERLCTQTLNQYVVRKTIQVYAHHVHLRQTAAIAPATNGRRSVAESHVRDAGC